MITSQELLDHGQDENRTMSTQEWLDFLLELQTDLEMRIESTRADLEEQDGEDYEEPEDDGIGEGGD